MIDEIKFKDHGFMLFSVPELSFHESSLWKMKKVHIPKGLTNNELKV